MFTRLALASMLAIVALFSVSCGNVICKNPVSGGYGLCHTWLSFGASSAYADKPDTSKTTPKNDKVTAPDPGTHTGDVNSKSAGKVNDNRPAKVCDNGNSDCPTSPVIVPVNPTPTIPVVVPTPKPTSTPVAPSGNAQMTCDYLVPDGLLGMTTTIVWTCSKTYMPR